MMWIRAECVSAMYFSYMLTSSPIHVIASVIAQMRKMRIRSTQAS